MASFSLPVIHDNPDGGWGPSANLPEQFKFKDIPYAQYSKSDKLGRFADWNDGSASENSRQPAIGLPAALPAQASSNAAGARAGRTRRDGGSGAQTFGSGTASAFAYFHVEDESSFSLVDNKPAAPRRGGAFTRGRGTGRGGSSGQSYAGRGQGQRGRGVFVPRGGAAQRGGRRPWRDWDKVGNALLSSTLLHLTT